MESKKNYIKKSDMVFAEDFDETAFLLKEHCIRYVEAVLEEIEKGNGEKYLTNPAVDFTKLAKAGEFDAISDPEYHRLLNHVEELSAFWDGQVRVTAWDLFCRWNGKLRFFTEEKRNAFAKMIVENSDTFDYGYNTNSNDTFEMEYEYDTYILQKWKKGEAGSRGKDGVLKETERLLDRSPKSIYHYMHGKIYGQEEAVKTASMLLYNHLRGRKRNVLFLGPTGCGKTEIWRVMQKLYSNIYIFDSTRLTKEGWTGGFKLQNIFDGISTEQAEHAIIVFDEFDKLCEPLYGAGGSNYSTSMQNELLKFLEGTTFECLGDKEKGPRKICTDKISFVFCGSFENLMSLKQESQTSLGFGSRVGKKDVYDQYESSITAEDLANYGNVRREICGRINQIVQLHKMTAADYEKILDMPKLSPLVALEKEYAMRLTLKEDARASLAKRAELNQMGVRYLYSALRQMVDEELFQDENKEEYVLG